MKSLRDVVLSVIICLMCLYLLYYWSTVPSNITIEKENIKGEVTDTDIKKAEVENIEIPVFRGRLLAKLYADEATYKKGEPIKLKNPVVYHYGMTKVTKIMGKFGEMNIAEENSDEIDLKDMRIWGDLRLEQRSHDAGVDSRTMDPVRVQSESKKND